MGEDIELQSLENLLEKFLPIEQEKPYTFFKRHMRDDENRYNKKVVFKSSIPWHVKVPWDYTSFPGTAELWSKAKAGLFFRYSYENWNFKSLLEYSYSRPFLKTKIGYRKNGIEVGTAVGTSLQNVPEYLDAFCSCSFPNINSRVNFLYMPEVSALVMTASGLFTRYVTHSDDNKYKNKLYPQIYGAEVSCEVLPMRLLRGIFFHRRYYDQNKLTFAFVQKYLADESYAKKLLVGYTMKLKQKKKLISCLSFDLKHDKLVFHLLYSKPNLEQKGSMIRYKLSSEGRIGTDIITRKKNMLISWNFEVNLLPLAQKESFGLFKFGVRFENIHEKLFSYDVL